MNTPTPPPPPPQAAPAKEATATPSDPNRPMAHIHPTEPTNQKEQFSTQMALQISELRDGMAILKDGSFRAVIACRSINFDLMSEMEREGIEYSYQGFLNSLNFPIQLLVRSARVDITPYLDRLSDIRRKTDNMLLGVLMDDYMGFVMELAEEANIMDKSFFITIPYLSGADLGKLTEQTKGFLSGMFTKKSPTPTVDKMTYQKAQTELENRSNTVIAGLLNIGVHSVRLNTRELAQLYYNFNNPDTAVRQPLVGLDQFAQLYVKKGKAE